MPTLQAVDYDPFATPVSPPAGGGLRRVGGPRLVPVAEPPAFAVPPAPDNPQQDQFNFSRNTAEEPGVSRETPMEQPVAGAVVRGLRRVGLPTARDLAAEQAAYDALPWTERAGAQFKSGAETLKQSAVGTLAKAGGTLLTTMDRIDRGEAVPEIEDPAGYQHMPPEDRQALRNRTAAGMARNVTRLAESESAQRALPRNPAADAVVQRANAGDWSGAWQAFTSDPAGIMQQFTVESLPLALPGLAAGAVAAPVGGVPGFLIGLAGGSYPTEYGIAVVDLLRERGIDMQNQAAVETALQDPAFLAEAGRRGNMRGTAIAAFDAAGGRLAAPLRAGAGLRNAGIAGRNVAVETASEMAGEATAQAASTGEIKPGDILAEGLGALPQSAGITAAHTAMQSGEAAPAPAQQRQEPYFGAEPPQPLPSVDLPPVPEAYPFQESAVPAGALPAEPVIGPDPRASVPAPAPDPAPAAPALPSVADIMEDDRPLDEIRAEQDAIVNPPEPEPEATRSNPVVVESPEDLDRAALRTNPAPTPAQAEAGNYAKAVVDWNGLRINIETPRGGERVAKDGSWSVPDFPAHYGEIRRTEGADGDPVDVYMGPDVGAPGVFVIDQIDPATGRFDEHKVMLGFSTPEAAMQVYGRAFSDGSAQQRIGAVKPMTLLQFKNWLKNGDATQPVAYVPKPAVPAQKRRASLGRPLDVVEFIAANGGVLDPDGELRAMDAHRIMVPKLGNLYRKAGLEPDQMREALEEAGYLPPGSTPVAMYDLMRQGIAARKAQDFRARGWSQRDAGWVVENEAQALGQAEDRRYQELVAEITGLVEENGGKLLPEEVDRVAALVSAGEAIEEAIYIVITAGAIDADAVAAKVEEQVDDGADTPFPETEPASADTQRGPGQEADADAARGAARQPERKASQSEPAAGDAAGTGAPGGEPAGSREDQGEEEDAVAAPTASDADAKAAEQAHLKVWNSGPFKAWLRKLGAERMPHRESPVAADMVRGWRDAKDDTPPAVRKLDTASMQPTGFNPISPYLMGYWGGRFGEAKVIRALKAGDVMGSEEAMAVLSGNPAPPAPTTEKTEQGEQAVIPGAERAGDRTVAERRMEGGKKPAAAQKPADEGLFDTGARQQQTMFDRQRQRRGRAIPLNSADGVAADEVRISEDAKGYVRLAPEYVAKREALAASVAGIITRMTGRRDMNVIVVDRLLGRVGEADDWVESSGMVDPMTRLLVMAMDSPDALGTARHESIHLLRAFDIITPAEWQILAKAAEADGWLERHGIAQAYPDLDREGQIEEAIAAQFGIGDTAQGQSQAVRAIFRKIAEFLRRVRAAFRNLLGHDPDWRDIFSAIEAGSMAAEESPLAQAVEAMAARRPPAFQRRPGWFDPAGKAANDFVPAPDHARDFGRISEDVARSSGLQALPIRLRVGNPVFGYKHIVRLHGPKLIAEAGSVENFVYEVARNFNRVGRTSNGDIRLTKTGTPNWALGVDLREEGTPTDRYYSVVTAFTSSAMRDSLLWEEVRTPASQDAGNPAPYHSAAQNESDEPPSPRKGQSRRNILSLPQKGKMGTNAGDAAAETPAATDTSAGPADAGTSGAPAPESAADDPAGEDGVRPSAPDETGVKFQRRTAPPNLFGRGFDAPSEQIWEYLQDRNLPLTARIRATSSALGEAARQKLQDKYLPLRRTQEAIELVRGSALDEGVNAYLAEELYHGRTGKRLDDFRTDAVEPLIQAINDEGLSLENVDSYLYARHAGERNARIAKINEAMPDGGSGMSNAEADVVMAGLASAGKIPALERVAKKIDAIIADTMTTRLDSGLLDAETAKLWRDTYKAYVPLRGFAEADLAATEEDGGRRPRTGRGFDVRGKESQQAFGRGTKAADILANVISMHEEAIVRAEKNRVGQTFLKLVQQNPNPDMWEISKTETMPHINKTTGMVEYGPDPLHTLKDNVLSVKVDGKPIYITIHHDGLARAMKNIGADTANGLLRAMQRINRYLAFVNTSLNPEFVLSNFARDIQTAAINLQGVDVKGIALRSLRDVPKALRGAYAGLKNQDGGAWSRHFDDYARAGGKTEFFALEDVTQKRKRIEALLADINPDKLGKVRQLARAAEKAVQDVNGAVENAIRLAVFVNLRKSGATEKQAASVAKNLTVNFNRKGEWAGTMSALYLFYNASMQGTVRMLQAMRHRKVQLVVAGIVIAHILLDILNGLMAPDDDDKENRYDKIPAYTKNHNIIVVNPFAQKGDKSIVGLKIPVPYGYNVFSTMGYKIGEQARSAMGIGKKRDPWKQAADLAVLALESFNPVGGEANLIKTIVPTALKPLYELETNRNFMDAPIMPEQPAYGPPKPDSERHFRSVSAASKWFAKELNELTGGNSVRPGGVSVSPETFDHWVAFVTGGTGAFVNRTSDFFFKAATGRTDDISWNTVPFARRLVEGQNPYYTRSRFYEIKTAAELAELDLKAAARDGRAQQVRREYRAELVAAGMLKASEKQLREYNQARRLVEANKALSEDQKAQRLKRIDEASHRLMTRIIARYNSEVRKTDR
jgi:hypothetical protein